ncbi:MAG: protein translocase subunit SecD [Verrucomicrobiota bacterium]
MQPTNETPAAAEAAEKPAEAAAEATIEASTPASEAAAEETAAADAAEAAAEAAETTASASEGVVLKGIEPAEAAGGIAPEFSFVLGVVLLGLFIWYIASEKDKAKRLVGTILSLAVAGLAGWFFYSLPLEKGIEIQGGVSMEIKIEAVQGRTITPETQDQVMKILERRLNETGAGEIILAPSGKDGVFLQIPGVGKEKLAEIEKVLEKVAKLEFSILHEQSSFLAQAVASGAQVVPGYEALPFAKEEDEDGNVLPQRYGLVKINKEMSGKYVTKANYYFGPRGPSVNVGFNGDGAKIMGPLTFANINRPMAIILDDEILSAPNIESQLTDGCIISGSFTEKEARDLAAALENPLENPINVAYSNYISPSMGEATIRQGWLAGVAGLALTLLFILGYYRFAGILALIGLVLNVVIIFGCLALFGFTLTLPGIAGIILTIGVAIDANVLIYERLREELKAGKSIWAAIQTAYDKAFSAIIDANITTLITAVLLYLFATGTVKGFAITLIIGILASLFTALIVTRVGFSWVCNGGPIKKLSFANIVPDKVVDFLGKRKICMIASVILVVISAIIVPLKDPRGVELKGGDKIEVQVADGITTDKVEESLGDLSLSAKPLIQKQDPVGGEGSIILIRSADGTANIIQEELAKDLNVDLNDTAVSSVGSAIGKSMLKDSIIAILIGLAAILLYVTIRFEFAFALGAIVALFHDLIITAGITTLLGQEFSLITVGAFLTIAGYSINDTIVVFDRVREGLATKRGNVKDIMNYCLNATLSRTILTSATTLLIVIVLFLFGGPGLRNFALTLIVGVLVGTYSSIFIASPIVLWWAQRTKTNLRRQVLDTEQAKIDPLANS